jgi:hypothetical protein
MFHEEAVDQVRAAAARELVVAAPELLVLAPELLVVVLELEVVGLEAASVWVVLVFGAAAEFLLVLLAAEFLLVLLAAEFLLVLLAAEGVPFWRPFVDEQGVEVVKPSPALGDR